jgi:signal transduction histidine kinase
MNDGLPDSIALPQLLTSLSLHDHLCLIYETPEQQLASAITFMQVGLDRGQKCLYVADENTATGLTDAMRTRGVDVEAALRSGKLTLADKRQAYLKQGYFDPDEMLRYWTEAIRETKATGYSALRFAGEMTWALGKEPGTERLIEYEVRLNDLLCESEALCICQYNRRRFSAEIILQVLRSHTTVIYGGHVCKNPYFVPPAEFLRPDQKELEVALLLKNIQSYESVERALREARDEWEQSFNAIADYVCIVSLSGAILRANRAMREKFESVHPDLAGLDYRQVYWGTALTDAPAPWDSVLKGGSAVAIETQLPAIDGWYSVASYPLCNEMRKQWGAVFVVRDITARKGAEKALQFLSGRLLRLQDEERRRVARDLHDSMGQDLVALAATLGQLRASIPASNRKSRKLAAESEALTDHCIREVRTLSYLLHPAMLDEAGLDDAIRHYVEGFTKRTGIQVDVELPPDLGRMPRDTELTLFRVVQESLTNIQRHAETLHAEIRIRRDPRKVTLEISDRGRGFIGSGRREGRGLPSDVGVGIPSMDERVRLAGGQFEIHSASSGTTVRATVPINDSTHEDTSDSSR